MARQPRITLDGRHFFIDLVFYNHRRELTAPDENPPIGIVLCTDKSEAVVRYTLPDGDTRIFASRYKLHLPTEEELAAELQRERRQIELVARLGSEA